MQFPIFYPPYLGDGAAIGIVAVLHVIISHGIAIGFIAVAVLAEYLGIRDRSEAWESFARRSIRFAAIIITSVGALTGVGIWFFTSAFVPRAIGSMLRVFFWPWFAEWLVFASEVGVLLAYYFLWESWRGERKVRHLRLGMTYVGLAVASAFLISGILGFMLTSDGWPWSRSFWQAFFNPSFGPQFLLRLAGSFALGALFSLAFLFLRCHDADFRKAASRLFGSVLLVSTAATGLLCWWYFAVAPSAFTSHATKRLIAHSLPAGHLLFWLMNGLAALIVLATAVLAARGRLLGAKVFLLPAIILALAFVGEFEYIREFMRGPYIMPGYMYASGLLTEERGYLSERGLLANNRWYSALESNPKDDDAGSLLFAQNCCACHTVGGMSSITQAMQGRSEDGIYAILGHTHELVPWMPPFTGTEAERKTLAAYLHRLTQGEVKETHADRFPRADSE